MPELPSPETNYSTSATNKDAHDSLMRYYKISSLTPSHLIDGNTLVEIHHGIRQGRAPRVRHLLAGAWTQIELAHVRDFAGCSAEARELILLAKNQTQFCEEIINREDRKHEEFFDRLYRTRLLHLYTDHYLQLGPVNWPEQPTGFQQQAYQKVQKEILNPLIVDFQIAQGIKNNREAYSDLKGLLGEITVLQCLNRLQREQEYTKWTVTPSSVRENSVSGGNSKTRPSTAFDIKCTFADHSFVPIETKWRKNRRPHSYDPSITLIYVNGDGRDALSTAQAMSREVAGEALNRFDAEKIENMTDFVLYSIQNATRIGVPIKTLDNI